ncbi:SID1 transmembrane family member 1 [Pitangus sulphuratus]|nr:SID1 transmembrane family member 1 [Pitangus sulphuratus]
MAGSAAPAAGALLCALLWAAAAAAAAGGGPGGSPAPAAFGRVYRGAVNISAERVYAFAYRSEPGQVDAVRVYVNSSSENLRYPVLFVVRQQKGVLSWQVPLIFRGLYQRTYKYQEVSRTLCPSEPTPETRPSDQIIFVDVASMAPFNIAYELLVTRLENFQLETNKAFNFTASPSQPQDVDSVIINVVSDAAYPCSVVSVQDIVCPVYDLDHNVEFNGVYQSMTKQAAITVQRKDFPGEQFFVVFVIKPEDYACGGSVPSSIHESVYVQAMFFSFLSFLSFYLGSVVVAFVHYIRDHGNDENLRVCPSDLIVPQSKVSLYEDTGVQVGIVMGPDQDMECQSRESLMLMKDLRASPLPSQERAFEASSPEPCPDPYPEELAFKGVEEDESSSSGGRQMSSPECRPPAGSDTDSSVEEESDFDTMPEIESDKNIIRTKVFLYLSDLSRKDRRIVSKKYKIYFWNIITIAVFYALPVIQLVITYQTVVNVTGNQDICYYNFLCAHPLGVLSAFNNILSNVGHMMLGFLFLLIVLRRDILHRRAMEMKDIYTLDYGIPKHFGLFYAMGIALMMEGVLSACYHVCPNYSNFQFDTSFMYMIAGLCMLKLYQTRHPDINASAYSAYASFAVVICLAVLGVVFGKNDMWFWVVFSIIHVLASLALSTQIYYMGRFKMDLGIFRRAVMVLYTDCIQQCSRPMYMDRMVLLIVGNLVNWSFAIFGLVYRPRDFASYILGIFICNLLLYLAFYIIMKLRSSEKLLPIPMFCIVSTAVVWAAALYFFFQNLSSWEETPAESREKNRPCILLGFFDDHDVWHFLSAAALFFSFLVLLTLDDDLDTVRRDKIPVF